VAEESPFKGQTGLRRVWNAFHYSRAGLHAAYVAEDAFRQEVLLAALLIPLAFFLSPNGLGLALMIGSVLLVLIVELLQLGDRGDRRPDFTRSAPLGQARQGHRQRCRPVGTAQRARRLGLRVVRLSRALSAAVPCRACCQPMRRR
jgi:hypothetical protein